MIAKKPTSLVTRIMIGLVAGVIVGILLNQFPEQKTWFIANLLQPAGDLFIKLMKMIVVPLVFACMTVGIAGAGNARSLGRVGMKTAVYFFSITSIAIVFGLIVGNVFQPGAGADFSSSLQTPVTGLASRGETQNLGRILVGIVPDNIVLAMSEGKLLSVLFFAIMFGCALSMLPAQQKAPLIAVMQGISDTMFKVTHLVMHYSPIGIFGLIAVTVASFGLSALLPLAKLIGITYLAVLLFAVCVLGLVARLAGVGFFHLLREIRSELLLAYSSAASSTVMPQLIEKMERYGAPRPITSMVIPLGYSFNLDGASLFAALGTLFIAQAYGIDLSLADQAMLVLIMVLTSKGAAGVPGFMFIILTATLTSAGLPVEGVAIIAGVYRLMDMPVTALNVLGNALAPLVIARWEGQLQPPDSSPTAKLASSSLEA
ncbi:dicarboxylate symporter family protein [Pseudomonas fluorescens]|uniref:Dicarboxylate symporter family protein n=1 Tax=Pseudomonas fluorescens TaxID=294 RepID=A0A0P9B8I0_PSEFL|nr:cation:dicarboxylase symporter family transporter [Pseudomonas fluorescens]KPU58995.1 dicarboxylate symporter family protein [Pseudomonas fluorescens]